MQIQLEIINKIGLENGLDTAFSVADAPRTIGRGKKADWVLPDAGRSLSSVHCRVSPAQHGFEIEVLSMNGIMLNGRHVEPGKAAPLADGDQLELGPYLMLATLLSPDRGAGEKTVVLGRRTAADEKTVVLLAKRPAAAAAKTAASLGAGLAEPARPVKPAALRPAASSHALGVEFVRAFADGAQIDLEHLAGRTDGEFARELGGAMRNAAQGLSSLAISARELRTLIGSQEKIRHETLQDAAAGNGMLAALFGADGAYYKRAEQAVGDIGDDLQAHDSAVFQAMQTALFRLLNEISPMTIEAESGSAFLRSKRAKSWDRYAGKWQSLSAAGENGMLDVFLDYFREAYDDKMGGH